MAAEFQSKVPSVARQLQGWLEHTGHSIAWLLEQFHTFGLTEIKERTVRKIVNGKQNPTAIQVKAISSITNISADRLLDTDRANLPDWIRMLDPNQEITNALHDLDEQFGGRRAAYHLLIALKTTMQLLIEQEDHPNDRFKDPSNPSRDLSQDTAHLMKDTIMKRLLGEVEARRRKSRLET